MASSGFFRYYSHVDSKSFTKITAPEEKFKLLSDLALAGGEILCKGQTDTIYKLKTTKFSNQKLTCSTLPDSSKLTLTHEVMIASFSLGGDKYFFQGEAQLSGEDIYFDGNFQIFRLQRRQNYRVKIPDSYKAVMSIETVNEQNTKLSAQLYDISSGGCRVTFQSDKITLKADDTLKTRVSIGRRDPMEITAVVRHIAPDPLDKKLSVLGLEFRPLTPSLESKLFAITMDLHRELFSKMA